MLNAVALHPDALRPDALQWIFGSRPVVNAPERTSPPSLGVQIAGHLIVRHVAHDLPRSWESIPDELRQEWRAALVQHGDLLRGAHASLMSPPKRWKFALRYPLMYLITQDLVKVLDAVEENVSRDDEASAARVASLFASDPAAVARAAAVEARIARGDTGDFVELTAEQTRARAW
jgi:hypothetical protein